MSYVLNIFSVLNKENDQLLWRLHNNESVPQIPAKRHRQLVLDADTSFGKFTTQRLI